MSQPSSHRTVSEYSVNSAAELQQAAYEVACPLIPSHGKPNMMQKACESRRGAAAKSAIQCACKHWPECGDHITPNATEDLRRSVRSAMTNVVGRAILDGKDHKEIAAVTGLSVKQIARHCRIISANPDLYPEFGAIAEGTVSGGMPIGASQPVKGKNAVALGKKMVDLFHQGFTRAQIAEKVCRDVGTVSKRLREAGISNPRRVNSFREQILKHLEEKPETTTIQLQAIFKCAKSTAEGYKKDFKLGYRA